MTYDKNQDQYYLASKANLQATCQYDGKKFGFDIKFQTVAEDADKVWELLNKNDRIVSKDNAMDFFNGYFINWAKKDMTRKGENLKTYNIPIGKLFFFETQLIDEDGENFVAEPQQIIWLLTPSNRRCITASRRLAKTTTVCQAEPLYYATMFSSFGTVIITQGWDTANKHLTDPQMWVDNNPRLQRWAGGMTKPWNSREMWFKNRSYLMAHTGSTPEKLRGLKPAPRIIIRDELAFHEGDNPEMVILSMGLKKSVGKETMDTVTSTPLGRENAFSKVQTNKSYEHFFHPLFCPKGYKRYYCDDTCPYFSWHGVKAKDMPIPECKVPLKYDDDGMPIFDNVFWRSSRISPNDVLTNFTEIGMSRFEQEFFLRPCSLDGNLFTKAYLDKYVFDPMLQPEDSNQKEDIYIGIDYGLTEASRTVIAIGKRIADYSKEDVIYRGKLINLIVMRKHEPYSNVGNFVCNELFNSYNIKCIVPDANTPSKDHVENELIPLLRRQRGFDNVIPYHTLGHSSDKQMAKAELLDFARNKFEFAERLRFYKEHELYAEMLSLRGKETQQGNLQIESSITTDRFMACMYMIFGMLGNTPTAIPMVDTVDSIYNRGDE